VQNEISMEINLLIWATGLTFIQMLIAALGSLTQNSLTTLIGNREKLNKVTGWAARAQRAHKNMLENLVLFAILVLATKLIGISNEMTILGAQLFFWGRVAFSIIYVAGVPWIRTVAWGTSIVGLILIFLELI
jgi:uncharacterized MAPEG superfamily protein